MGIYDLAGNVDEWTLEYASDTDDPCANRGGGYYGTGSNVPASYRNGNFTTGYFIYYVGARVALY